MRTDLGKPLEQSVSPHKRAGSKLLLAARPRRRRRRIDDAPHLTHRDLVI